MKLLKKPTGSSVFRDFRSMKDLKKPEYRHALLMLFWLADLPLYFMIQRVVGDYTVIHCVLDDGIPLLEGFSVFYLLWLPFFMGTLLYTMFFDPAAFRRGMYAFIMTFTITKFVYFFLPNGVELRPEVLPRKNFFTFLTEIIYSADRNINCCPSEHVIGAVYAVFIAFDSEKLSRPAVRAGFVTAGALICASVLFVRQHSVLDIVCAAPLILAAYLIFFRKGSRVYRKIEQLGEKK